MKKFILMALVAMTIFSCSKEDDNVTSNEPKSVKLSIKAGSLTRAVEQPVANGAKTTIHSLYVYFLDAPTGNIVSGSKAITGTDLQTIQEVNGLDITGVNSSAKYVYVVANANENGITLPTSGTLATIKAKTATMGSNNTGDWSNALLSNSDVANNGSIVLADNKYTANVSIMPDLSRIEISSIEAKTSGVDLPDYPIYSYDLKALYLNNYYSAFHIGGLANGTQVVLDGTADAIRANVPAWAKDVYGTALTGATTYTAAVGSGTLNDVWAYMLPAGNAPRVIFELENVSFGTVGNIVTPAVQTRFVTVKSFSFATGGGTVATFERGKVYKVKAVTFSANDTHENPNASDIDVTVTVEVLGWVGIDINPEL